MQLKHTFKLSQNACVCLAMLVNAARLNYCRMSEGEPNRAAQRK